MKYQTKQTFKIFWQHSKKYSGTMFALVFLMLAATAFEVYRPFLYKHFIDNLGSNNPALFGVLVKIVIGLFLVDFASWVFWRVSSYLNTTFQTSVMADLMNTCFQALHKHSVNFFNNNFSGSLVRRVTRYYRSFETIADLVYWDLGQTILKIALILVVLFFRYWQIGLVIFIWACVYVFFNYKFSQYKLKYDTQSSALDTKISGRVSDTVINNLNLKIFNGLIPEAQAFKKLSKEWQDITAKSWNLSVFSEGAQALLMIVLEAGILFIALLYWRRGLITIGDFVLLQSYLVDIFGRLWGVGRYIRRLYESLADAEEMTIVLNTPNEIQDIAGAKDLQHVSGEVEFKNVFFEYLAGRSILNNFNLKIGAGEKVALIGPSGGGKSTIVKLLLRFHEIQSGSVSVDGFNITEITQESLRRNISFVPQEPILFHRSLLENIRYARPEATEEEVVQAAKMAHCHEFISTLPEKYDTLVGERGIKLSGGERQRVAIARAILKDAPILVLDEATSSLDSESEALIQDALHTVMQNRTTIAIAHRLSTIMQMDRIIVVENGVVIEEGKHKELLKVKKGMYQKLWNIQAGGFTSKPSLKS